MRFFSQQPVRNCDPLKTVARENFPLSPLIFPLSKKVSTKVKNQGIRVPSFIKIA